MSNLTDVTFSLATVDDGDVLTWDASTGKWRPEVSAGGTGSGLVGSGGLVSATRVTPIQGLIGGTNVFKTLFGSNGIVVINQTTNISIEISDAELLVWSTHTTNTFVRTNDDWLVRMASNGVSLAAGTAISVANASSGIRQLWTVSVSDPELLVWATHTTNTFVRTNDMWLDRVASNRVVLVAGPGIQIDTVGVGTKQVNTISALAGEGVVTSSNVTVHGNFGFAAQTNATDVFVMPDATSWFAMSNYNFVRGSNFSTVALSGRITNKTGFAGWVSVDAVMSINFLDNLTWLDFGIQTNDAMSHEFIRYRANQSQQNDLPVTLHMEYYMPVDGWCALAVRGSAAVQEWIPAHYYLSVNSKDHRFTVITGGSGGGGVGGLTAAGGLFVEDQGGGNFLIYPSNIVSHSQSETVTNMGNDFNPTLIYGGPNMVRWGPRWDGVMEASGGAPGAGDPAKAWIFEVYPGGYTNLDFPTIFQWVDGGPYYQPDQTNLFELKWTGSNFIARSLQNGIVSGRSANISGHWIAPPLGIIGGKFNTQFRTNLLAANCMLTISNLIFETEVEIFSRGPIGVISNAESIMWVEGSQPYINTNGRTVMRFWMEDGLTNGMVLSQQIIDLVAGNDMVFTTDIANNRITIHSTAESGGGGAEASALILNVNPEQFEVSDAGEGGTKTLNFKNAGALTNGLITGNLTVVPDTETGQGGGIGATFFSSGRYIDQSVTNLGSAHIVTMVWGGPGVIRWSPTNNGVLTGGGASPQSGDAARQWQVIIVPNGATNITWPGAFQWLDGGPYFDRLRTNIYTVLFTGSNYFARRTSPGFTPQAGANITLTTNVDGSVTITAASASPGSGPTNGLGYLENLFGTAFINDDFAADSAATKFGREFWTQTVNGGGLGPTAGAIAGVPFAIETLTTNTADRAGYHLGTVGGNLLLSNYTSITFLARVQIRNVSDGTDRHNSYFGFFTPWTSEPTSGVYIRATNNVWEIVTSRASAFTVTSTGTNVSADAWIWIGVTLEGNTNAVALIGPSETTLTRVTTNQLTIPGDQPVSVGFNQRRTGGTTTRMTNRVDKFMAFSK